MINFFGEQKTTQEIMDITDYVIKETSAYDVWEKLSGNKNLKWEQNASGVMVEIGDFGGMPIVITVQWDRVNGKNIMFYEATSTVVHYDMINDWLEENCPAYKRGARTNTSNLHQFLHFACGE